MDITQLTDSSLVGAVAAGLLLGIFVILSISLRLILAIISKRINRNNSDRLLLVFIDSIKGPAVLLFLSLGFLFAYLTLARLEEGIFISLNNTGDYAFQVWKVSAISVATFT
ncbi:hypothetical protein OAJ44_02295, partial [Chloroflexi bacterium]|nr:hypothetical protein [Chloroflexota bacterium]